MKERERFRKIGSYRKKSGGRFTKTVKLRKRLNKGRQMEKKKKITH